MSAPLEYGYYSRVVLIILDTSTSAHARTKMLLRHALTRTSAIINTFESGAIDRAIRVHTYIVHVRDNRAYQPAHCMT